MTYSSYIITSNSRATLKKEIPFLHSRPVGHHITYKYPDFSNPPPTKSVKVIGVAQDDQAQALIVEIDGSTERPDKGTFHITWSLKHVPPVYSNTLIRESGWKPLEEPIEIQVVPMCSM
jgi:hypothetical protein